MLVTASCSSSPQETLTAVRTQANVASAIASLRTIASAQITYSAVCGGFFSPSLRTLGVAPTGSSDVFLGADLASDPAVKSGYTFTLTPAQPVAEAPASCNGLEPGRAVRDFFVVALPSTPGAPYLALMADATLYQSTAPIPVTFGAKPAPPAVPVR